jgi:hypothetical protein
MVESDRRALERVALGLTVQRLVLAELLEHDHRQQAWTRPGPRDRVERRRGRGKKTTIVALARKLLVALWKSIAFGVVIDGAVMKNA